MALAQTAQRLTEADYVFYPDVTAVCGEQRLAGDRDDALINPTLLAEVLSDSTEA